MTETATQTPPRILVVDDCATDRALIMGLLKRAQRWQVDGAADGKSALAWSEPQPPDLMVTDLQMPEMDGLTLVDEVKRRWPNLPVVLVTGRGSEQIAIEALRAGAASYTPKSALAGDLVRTVEFVLNVCAHTRVPRMASRLQSPFQHGFVLENDCCLIGPLLEHLQSRLPPWSESEQLRISMAVGEALVNAMHHGNLQVSSELRVGDEQEYHDAVRQRRAVPPYSQRRVHVQTHFDEERVQVSVRDEGPGFRPAQVADPTAMENLEKLSGRGLLLIHSFMDEVGFNEAGNEITMVKRRPAAPLENGHYCGCGD